MVSRTKMLGITSSRRTRRYRRNEPDLADIGTSASRRTQPHGPCLELRGRARENCLLGLRGVDQPEPDLVGGVERLLDTGHTVAGRGDHLVLPDRERRNILRTERLSLRADRLTL